MPIQRDNLERFAGQAQSLSPELEILKVTDMTGLEQDVFYVWIIFTSEYI